VAQGPKRDPTLALERENTWGLALERPLSAVASAQIAAQDLVPGLGDALIAGRAGVQVVGERVVL
jgi:hypothetical protein